MRNIKTRLAGLAVAFFVLLTGLAFSTGGSAQATVSPEQQEEVCYEQVSYQEYQFRKTVTTPAVEEVSHVEYKWDIETRTEIKQPEINKETQTRTATSSNYGISWSAWSEWGPWTDWPNAGPVWDDGRARGPAPHGSGFYDNSGKNREKWERQYRYVETGRTPQSYTPPRYTAWAPAGSTPWGLSSTPPADTATTRYVNKQERTVIDQEFVPGFDTTYYYTGGEPSTLLEDAVWTESNPGEPWEQFNERTSTRQQEVECPPVTTVPPTTTPPTTEPPVTTVPPTTQPPVDTTVPPVVTTTPPPATTVVVATDIPPVPPTVPPAGLPATGSTSGGLVAAAAILLGLGSLAVLASRRRKVA